MELSINNFKCFTDYKLSFTDGMVILKGLTGKGKTSIIESILYALFGKAVIRSNITPIHSKKSKKTSDQTLIEIKWNGLIIRRGTGNNRSIEVINTSTGQHIIDDDSSAQQFIYDQVFPLCVKECIGDFYKQSRDPNVNGFLVSDSASRIGFIKSFCGSIDSQMIRDKLGFRSNTIRDILLKSEGERETLKSDICYLRDRLDAYCSNYNIVGNDKSGIARNRLIQYLDSKFVNDMWNIYEDKLSLYNETLRKQHENESKLYQIMTECKHICNRIQRIGEVVDIDVEHYIKQHELFDKQQEALVIFKAWSGYDTPTDQVYDKLLNDSTLLQRITDQLSKYDHELYNLRTKHQTYKKLESEHSWLLVDETIKYIESNIDSSKASVELYDVLKREQLKLQNDLQSIGVLSDRWIPRMADGTMITSDPVKAYELVKSIRILLNVDMLKLKLSLASTHDVYACPSCKTDLRLTDGCLVVHVHANHDQVMALKVLETYGVELEHINMQSFKRFHSQADTYLDKLAKKSLLEQKLDEVNRRMKDIDYDMHLDIKSKYHVLSSYKQLHQHAVDDERIKFLESECERLREQIRKLQSIPSDWRIRFQRAKSAYHALSEPEYDLKSLHVMGERRNSRIELEQIYAKRVKDMLDMIKYTEDISDIDKPTPPSTPRMKLPDMELNTSCIHQIDMYEDMIREKLGQLDNIESTIKSYLTEQETCKRILSIVKALETDRMVLFTHEFNTIINDVLTDCFDEPIRVSLELVITGKTEQQTSKVHVHYKGSDMDLRNLSNGEYQRVMMASHITLAIMLKTPIIVLDEITSHLDENTCAQLFHALKSRIGNCIVLTVAHNVTTGVFDQVINIE
jgi:DNA repair exonuclease SbcCD ATPase subunit